MKKLILFSIVLFAFTAGVMAQLSATASATATIVSPLSITHTSSHTGLSFGNIIAAATDGWVRVFPDGTHDYDEVDRPSILGDITPATFTIMGMNEAAYTIVLPTSVVINSAGGNMTVNNFQSNPTAGTHNLPVSGSETLSVGATLNVAAGQAAGDYTGTFSVSVNYN